MTKGELLAEMPKIAEEAKFIYGNFEYGYEIAELKTNELRDLILLRDCSTRNVLAELQEQQRFHFLPEQKKFAHDLDSLFRWTAVSENQPLLAFETPAADDTLVAELYLLIRLGIDRYYGLKTKRCYLPEEA